MPVDLTTCSPKAMPVPGTTVDIHAQTFEDTRVSRYRRSSIVTTDHSRQLVCVVYRSHSAAGHAQTAGYHSSANAMLERLRRQLKGALAVNADRNHWKTNLYIVILGTRFFLKPDICCTAAELVFCTSLRLPAEFFDITNYTLSPISSEYIVNLRRFFSHIHTTSPCLPRTRRVFASQHLVSCRHGFIRREAVKSSLASTYDGLFQVFAWTPKIFS